MFKSSTPSTIHLTNSYPLHKKDIDLYAVWTTTKYNIVYNANGAVGTMETQTNVEYGNDVALKVNTFVYTGFTFDSAISVRRKSRPFRTSSNFID